MSEALPPDLERAERRARWLVASALALQAVAIPCWWWALARWPESRALFFAAGTERWEQDAFRFPDLTLLAVGLLLSAILTLRRDRWATPAVWAVAGGMTYATLLCVAISRATDQAWAAVALMSAGTMTTLLSAGVVALDQGVLAIRVSRPRTLGRNRAKTLLQTAVVWGVSLGVLPPAIVFLERRLGASSVDIPGAWILAAALFVAGSFLGLWAAAGINRFGEGTPLPFDTARRLVLAPPYDAIRNPMAVGGTLQASAVAIAFGSVSVLVYTFAGALAWNYLARPYEESDLHRRFGDDFRRYREAVRCWRWRRRAMPHPDPASRPRQHAPQSSTE